MKRHSGDDNPSLQKQCSEILILTIPTKAVLLVCLYAGNQMTDTDFNPADESLLMTKRAGVEMGEVGVDIVAK